MKLLTLSSVPFMVAILAFFFVLLPTASAATSKPTCELTASTSQGSMTIEDDEDTVPLLKGEKLTIQWESKNAKKAFDSDGIQIKLKGTLVYSGDKNKTYTYQFVNGSKKAECAVTVQVVEGAFKESSLTTTSVRPTISGTASGTPTVQVAIYKVGNKKAVFTSKAIKVKKGKWSTKVTKNLPKGEYTISLFGEESELLSTIAAGSLSIGTTAKKKALATSFVIEPVPLLSGGTARVGSTVPVSYVQIINIGKAIGKLESFSLKQTGSASTNAIVGFVVADSKSTAAISVGSVTKPIAFKDGVATVPVDILIGAGEMRLFTIKAILAPLIGSNLTKQLKLHIAGVESNGKMNGTFPIRGTTWTLGL